MRERMKQRKIFVATETFPTKGDKSVRCQSSVAGSQSLNFRAAGGLVAGCSGRAFKFPGGAPRRLRGRPWAVGQILDRMHAPSVPTPKPKAKVLSTDPATNTIRMNDLWEAEERRYKRIGRI